MKRKLFLLVFSSLLGAFLCRAQEIVWTDCNSLPLYGKCTDATVSRYARFPESLKEKVSRKTLWDLGLNSAGLYVRFRSDATQIRARWTSSLARRMNHMTDAASHGLDLYFLDKGVWKFAGVGRPDGKGKSYEAMMVDAIKPGEREYMLYLSLYDGIESIEIGVPEGCHVLPPQVNRPSAGNPIVMYGTSILQGCSASRPGMCATAMIGRMFDKEVINLGFSANGQLDYELAELMAGIPDPALYILDNVPNSKVAQIEERAEKFIGILRSAHPEVPIIMIEDPNFSKGNLNEAIREEVRSKNIAWKAIYQKELAKGSKDIFYIPASYISGRDGEDFVDGIHYTDLGMTRYVAGVSPFIRKALGYPEATKDWAGARTYGDAQVSARPKAVFMGDSITEGWYRDDPEFFKSHNFLGRGISGQTSSQMLVRFRQDVLSHKPKYAVILAGTNDIARNNGYMPAQQSLDNIKSMCELARSNGIKPIICSLTPCDRFSWRLEMGDPSSQMVRMNDLLRDYARSERIPYADYHSALKEKDGERPAQGLTKDGCHPTHEAYLIMEEIILKYIK